MKDSLLGYYYDQTSRIRMGYIKIGKYLVFFKGDLNGKHIVNTDTL